MFVMETMLPIVSQVGKLTDIKGTCIGGKSDFTQMLSRYNPANFL